MSSKFALKLVDISKVYRIYDTPTQRMREILFGNRRHKVITALHSTSFNLHPGEVLGILGRNGAGKSTLLQMIAGTLTPTTGHVVVNGKITALLELGSGFNPDFTGRENVFLYGSILGLTKSRVRERLQEILAFAEIGEFIDRPLKTYSSGMKVRLAFATVVGLEPEIIIVDEALAVGDAAFQLKCMRLINSLKEKGKTFIFVSHSIPQIVSFCTRAMVIESGKVIFDGQPKDAVHIYKSTLFPEERKRLLKDIQRTGGAIRQSKTNGSDRITLSDSSEKPTEIADKNDQTEKQEGDASEYRFGNNVARIERLELVGSSNEPMRVFASHDEVILRLFIRADREIGFPVYGFRIRNVHGLDVYIKNTQQEKKAAETISPYQTHCIEFHLTLALAGGDYFVSAGISELTDTELVPLDRRMDVLKISVFSTDNCGGIANLNAAFIDHDEVNLD